MKRSSSASPTIDAVPAVSHRRAAALGWVKWRLLCRSAVALWHAPVKLSVISACWSILVWGLYVLGYEGLRFMFEVAGLGPFLVDRLWYLFLFVVTGFLGISQLATTYSTLVRVPETRMWLSLPIAPVTICRAKYLESAIYSAWGVLLLTLPISVAYLVIMRRPLGLLLWLAAVLLPLIGIVTALSSTVLLVWLRWFGRFAMRREVMALGFVAACGLFFWFLGDTRQSSRHDVWFIAMQELLPRLKMAMSPWLPSSWAATAFGAVMHERWSEALLYTLLLWTTALTAWRVWDRVSGWLFVPVMRRQGAGAESARPMQAGDTEFQPAWWMRGAFRALLVKDIFLVIRDPAQWSQGVVFFGLLGAYFANIHRLTRIGLEPAWRIGIASLNLACTLLVFGSLAVRFIFPQLSLEGRNLWLLRTSPTGVRDLLRAKLWCYGAVGILVIEGLLWMSMARLNVPPAMQWWLAAVGVMAALTIVALTVGLGACWMDPTAQDAARVVASSDGALVLVAMLAYVGTVVTGLVFSWAAWSRGAVDQVISITFALMALSVLTGWLPIRFGAETIRRVERT